MALRLIGLTLQRRQPIIIKGIQVGNIALLNTINKIGNREIVGHGINGGAIYYDKVEFPMPAIRFREETPKVTELREKEKGDWNELSMDEKKILYRHSFCQNFPEMLAFSGEWKMHIGIGLLASAIGFMAAMITNIVVFGELPFTYGEPAQKARLKRLLDLEMNPICGLASKWNYEKKRWK